jgi:hypothetical protein
MLVASVGAGLATDLGIGLSASAAEQSSGDLRFGDLEPLVGLMQDTPAPKLLPILVKKIQEGTSLKELVAAGALANARTFGGHDYIGFHTFMALGPALKMAGELKGPQQALPVLKVLYRNTDRMQALGGSKSEVLHAIEAGHLENDDHNELLREATRAADMEKADRIFAAYTQEPLGEAYNHLQFSVQDEVDVHRVVLAWRAWETLDVTGQEHGQTLLRQSVHYCVLRDLEARAKGEAAYQARFGDPNHIRQVLPKLLDQYKLIGRETGTRKADDAWIEQMSRTIADSDKTTAADAVAAALADGFAAEDIGEAISLASNGLLLRNIPNERTHGDSVGVHASDSAIAWRNIARVSNQRNQMASLVTAAFHTAGQTSYKHTDKLAYPLAEHKERIKATDAAGLLKQAEGAIRENDQATTCAAIQKYGELGLDPRPAFDLLLKFAISEDGRLHNEKYYRTVVEEYEAMRPAFKWRQPTALARVVASSFGYDREDKHGFKAPGYEEACRLLGVTA